MNRKFDIEIQNKENNKDISKATDRQQQNFANVQEITESKFVIETNSLFTDRSAERKCDYLTGIHTHKIEELKKKQNQQIRLTTAVTTTLRYAIKLLLSVHS